MLLKFASFNGVAPTYTWHRKMGRQAKVLKTLICVLVRLECITKSYLAVFLYPFCFRGLWNRDNPILKNIMLLIIKILLVSKKMNSLQNIPHVFWGFNFIFQIFLTLLLTEVTYTALISNRLCSLCQVNTLFHCLVPCVEWQKWNNAPYCLSDLLIVMFWEHLFYWWIFLFFTIRSFVYLKYCHALCTTFQISSTAQLVHTVSTHWRQKDFLYKFWFDAQTPNYLYFFPERQDTFLSPPFFTWILQRIQICAGVLPYFFASWMILGWVRASPLAKGQ